MRPLVPCHSVDMLRWFLGKTTVSAVFATWTGWETTFPDDLRQAAAAISITVDFACAPVKTIAAATGKTVPAGDCVVFAGGRYVGRMLEERPRTGAEWVEALLVAGTGKPGAHEPESPCAALIRVLREALSQAAALPQFARADPREILGVTAGAPLREVRRARALRLAEYHPDRVAHLGAKLREVADTQTLLINWAFEQLRDRSAEAATAAPKRRASTPAPPARPAGAEAALMLRKRRRARQAAAPQRQLRFQLA